MGTFDVIEFSYSFISCRFQWEKTDLAAAVQRVSNKKAKEQRVVSSREAQQRKSPKGDE